MPIHKSEDYKLSAVEYYYTFLHFKRRFLYSPIHIKIIYSSSLFFVFYFLEHISLVFRKHP